MEWRFSCVSSVIDRKGYLQNNRKRTPFFFRTYQQPPCYNPNNGNSNIHNISWSNEDKTDIGACPASLRVHRHLWDYRERLLRAHSTLICRNYSDQCIRGGRLYAGGYFFVSYNKYLMSCGPICTFFI